MMKKDKYVEKALALCQIAEEKATDDWMLGGTEATVALAYAVIALVEQLRLQEEADDKD